MLKKIKLSILILILSFSLLNAQEIEDIGYLTIESKENAEIYLEDVLISNVPFKNLALAPGIYKIESYFTDDLNWLNRGVEKVIEIKKGENKTYNLSPEKLIRINSDPYNCEIVVGKKVLGYTPLIINGEKYFNNSFTLRKQNYEEKSFSLDNFSRDYLFKLKSKEGYRDSPVLKSSIEKNNFKWLREGLIIITVASSWASFYFKREADDYYFQYEHTANPVLMEKFYNKSLDYDRYSHIAIGASVISLGTYLYLLLSE